MLSYASAAPKPAAAAAAAPKKRRADSASLAESDPSRIRVVLRKDVKGLGRRGDVLLVKRGLMRHDLYPHGDAAYATPENVARYALSVSEKQSLATDEGVAAGPLAAQLIKALNRKPVVVTRRPASADSESFSGPVVAPRDIREAVARQLGIQLHLSHLMVTASIDTFGSFKVPLNLRLPDNRQAELTVHVDRRGKQAEAGAEAQAGRSG